MRIVILFTDAGSGHRTTARALQEIIESHYPWQVELVNPYQDIISSLDYFKRWTGRSGEDWYNSVVLQQGRTTLCWPLLAAGYLLNLRLEQAKGIELLERFWQNRQPDLVLSVLPLLNDSLYESLQKISPQVPFVTLLTDFCESVRNTWFQNRDQYYICGTHKALCQAYKVAVPEKIFATSGMVLSPHFYQPFLHDPHQERQRLGLDPDLATGLVMFGGASSTKILKVAKTLCQVDQACQFIFVCGHNRTLVETLAALPTPYPKYVVGFTDRIPYYMSLADFFIGKPGPAAVSEALVMNLPVLVELNRATMFQERYNAQWIKEKGVGLHFANQQQLLECVSQMFDPNTRQLLHANVRKLENRAIFEIPHILEQLVGSPDPQSITTQIP